MQRHIPRYMLVSLTLGLVVMLGNMGKLTPAAAQGDLEAGKQMYQQRCTPCHGPDGKANTPVANALNPRPRDHTDGAYMNKLSPEHLTKVIKQGGVAVGKSPIMPPQADLTGKQIQQLITFLRSLATPAYQAK